MELVFPTTLRRSVSIFSKYLRHEECFSRNIVSLSSQLANNSGNKDLENVKLQR